MRNPRVLFAAGVVLAALVVAVVVLPLATGGSREDEDDPPRVVRAKLTLERFTPQGATEPELLVSLSAPRLNTLNVTDGERVVWLRCFDGGGAVAIRRPVDWPLLEEVGYLPHIHQPANRRLLAGIRECRVTGPGLAFEGRVAGRLPTAG